MKDKKKTNSFTLRDQIKDELAVKMLRCLHGFVIQDAIDQLDYTKDFLKMRLLIGNIDDAAIVEEGKQLRRKPGRQ